MSAPISTRMLGTEGLQSASARSPGAGLRESRLAVRRAVARTAILFTALLVPFAAKADGSVLRLRETRGPFVVTIFSPADSASGRPVEIAVLVQRGDTGAVVMDATVDLTLTPPVGMRLVPGEALCGPAGNMLSSSLTGSLGQSTTFRATRGQSANKLFYSASLVLRAAGDWQLRVSVRQGDEEATVTCALPVGVPARTLTAIWPWLALPPVAIALFATNQWLRFRRARVLKPKSNEIPGRLRDFITQTEEDERSLVKH